MRGIVQGFDSLTIFSVVLSTFHCLIRLQEQGDILSSELSKIWKSAPKFPQVVDAPSQQQEQEGIILEDKIDVDSFIQVYRDIDDLFEDDDEGDVDALIVSGDDSGEEEESGSDVQLTQTFTTLTKGSRNNGNTISFSQLRQWDEITSLIEEGMLGNDEFVTLWETALNVEGEEGDMDLQGFSRFNDALDELFEIDDEALDEFIDGDNDDDDDSPYVTQDPIAEDDDSPVQVAVVPLPIITEEDLPPGVLFSQLANENYLVGKSELQRWGELNDMLKGGDLTVDELDTLYDAVAKAPGTKDLLDEDGFYAFYDAIDNLFEDETDSEAIDDTSNRRELKEELLDFIEDIAKISNEEGRQLCGLDCSELEQERVLEIVSELEREPYNQVVASSVSGSNTVSKDQLVGLWTLIYSSSSTMKYNEGLSGLAGGLTKFGGLQQLLSATKYLADVEYTEQVVGKLGGNSFEVKIKGDWDLRTEVSLFTGKPSNVLSVTPDRVLYGPRSDKADHWKSLGPMNLLVLSYLDEDLRVMRGNTSTDTLFIWRRSN